MDIYSESDHKELSSIAKYGTMCAPWDQMPGTPYESSCAPGSDFGGEANWCQIPWCYVDESCESAKSTDVFVGKGLVYSYAACSAPDCYNDPQSPGCPFDPHGQGTYAVFDPACPCIFHGRHLPEAVFQKYPSSDPGTYENNPHIQLYGTTCGAWDQSPDTPWYSYCPAGADWCHKEYNWCQIPWCYVSPECASAKPSSVFEGSEAAHYSYAACGMPNCYDEPYQEDCPASETEEMHWGAGLHCPEGSTEESEAEDEDEDSPEHGNCTCIFQGHDLPEHFYEDGAYANHSAVAKYGTMCAAWDQVPGTPWASSCGPGSDFGGSANWCQIPWCYVDKGCVNAKPTDVFEGEELFFSYGACGAPDCYSDPRASGCPYDPYRRGSYTVFDPDCACLFHGNHLPPDVYNNYPSEAPGVYGRNPHIWLYGTTCASWDQSPDTPWYSYCPEGADWCHPEYNWCQIPWCYVSPNCATAKPSSVFQGSSVAYYSYDTCLGAPNCFDDINQERCPFQESELTWGTGVHCPDGWTKVGTKCIKIPREKAESPFRRRPWPHRASRLASPRPAHFPARTQGGARAPSDKAATVTVAAGSWAAAAGDGSPPAAVRAADI